MVAEERFETYALSLADRTASLEQRQAHLYGVGRHGGRRMKKGTAEAIAARLIF